MKKITITADTTESQLDLIKPLIEAIKKFKPYQGEWMPGEFTEHSHNFPTREQLREDMGEKPLTEIYSEIDPEIISYFEEFCPYDDFGIHTITEIIVDNEKLL